MENDPESPDFFERLKHRPFWQRFFVFVSAIVAWYFVMSQLQSSDKDVVTDARSTNAYWLLSVVVLFIVSTFLFKRKG